MCVVVYAPAPMAIHLTALVTIAPAAVAMFAQGLGLAHGGGLDSEGGHADRRTGECHKHRDPDATARADAGECSERPRLRPQARRAPHAAPRLGRAVHLQSGRLRQGRGHRARRRVGRGAAQQAVVRQSAGVHARSAEHHRRIPACEPTPEERQGRGKLAVAVRASRKAAVDAFGVHHHGASVRRLHHHVGPPTRTIAGRLLNEVAVLGHPGQFDDAAKLYLAHSPTCRLSDRAPDSFAVSAVTDRTCAVNCSICGFSFP